MTDYYADPAASGGSGTIGDPWDLNTALNQSYSAGDNLFLRGGTYTGLTSKNITSNGTAPNPITMINYPAETPVIDDGDRITVKAQYWVFDGITFQNYSGMTDVFRLGRDGDTRAIGVVVQNCTFQNCTGRGVFLNNSDGCQVLNCTFLEINTLVVGTGRHAIEPSKFCDNFLLEGCTFTDCAADGIQLGGISADDTRKVTIRDCVFEITANAQANEPWGENAIDIKVCTGPVLVEDCTIRGFRPCNDDVEGLSGGSAGSGIYIHTVAQGAPKNVTVSNCLIEDCTRGISLDGDNPPRSENITITGCVFRDIKTFAGNANRPSDFGSGALWHNEHVVNMAFTDNIICDVYRYALFDNITEAGEWTGNTIADGFATINTSLSTWTINTTTWYSAATKHASLTDASDTDEAGVFDCEGAAPGEEETPPPDPGGTDVFINVAQEAARTTAGTQTFEADTRDKTPKAGLMIGTQGAANGIGVDGLAFGIGAYAGGVGWATSSHSEHGANPSDAHHRSKNDRMFFIYDDAGNVEGAATHSSFNTNAWTINWNTPPSVALLMNAVLFAGDDLQAAAGIVTPSATIGGSVVETIGFEFDIIIMVSTGHPFNDSSYWSSAIGVGIAFNNGGTIENYGMAFREENNRSPTTAGAQISNSQLPGSISLNGGIYHAFQITTPTATGFTLLNSEDDGSADDGAVAYLALSFGGLSAWAGIVNSPTATGAQSVTGPGFRPQLAMHILSLIATLDSATNDDEAGGFGISTAAHAGDYSNAINTDDGATAADTQSMADNQIINLPQHDGTAGLEATLADFTDTGYDLNWDSVLGTSRNVIGMAIEGTSTFIDIEDGLSLADSPDEVVFTLVGDGLSLADSVVYAYPLADGVEMGDNVNVIEPSSGSSDGPAPPPIKQGYGLATKSNTISNTALAISHASWSWGAADLPMAERAYITCHTEGIVISWDGTNPSAVFGLPLAAGRTIEIIGNINIQNLKFIRSGLSDAAVSVTLHV